MTDDELVNEFVAKVSSEQITFDKVRQQLEQRGLDQARIKQIVRRVDDEILTAAVAKSRAISYDRIIQLGIALLVFGALITLASFAGLFSSSNGYLVIVSYGPIVAGLVMIVIGRNRKNRKNKGLNSDAPARKFRLRDRQSH